MLIEPKLLLRELCDYGWDDVINEDKVKRWQAWLYSLNHLEGLCIPRCFKPPQFVDALKYQLHLFADASEVAYGAMAYLRIEDKNGQVQRSFVMGKSHLAPIPRLELLAAVTAVRLYQSLKEQLPVSVTVVRFGQILLPSCKAYAIAKNVFLCLWQIDGRK